MRWISAKQWNEFARENTNAHRLGTGSDGWLDRYGDQVIWSGTNPAAWDWRSALSKYFDFSPKVWLTRELSKKAEGRASARIVLGEGAERFSVQEDGVSYHVEPTGGYSTGLFLDQRLNRRWVRALKPARTLNLFAYTGSFSVCAALGGGQTLSVDAARSHLTRARENFALNGLDVSNGHRFLAEDAMKIVPRLIRRGEFFDLIVLDPPTFGRGGGAVFRLTHDLPVLVRGCFDLLNANGWLLVSCNYAGWTAHDLRRVCTDALRGRRLRVMPGESPQEIPTGAISWKIKKEQ